MYGKPYKDIHPRYNKIIVVEQKTIMKGAHFTDMTQNDFIFSPNICVYHTMYLIFIKRTINVTK